MTRLQDGTRAKLMTVSVATLTTAPFKRGLRNQFIQDAHLADELANDAVEMTAFEDCVTEEGLKGRSILGLYPQTDERTVNDFAAWRVANKR